MPLPDLATRLRHLDNRPLVLGVFVVLVAIFLGGELLSPVPYTDPGFVVAYFGTEVTAALALLVVTVLLFPARHIGLRAPVWAGLMRAWPLLVLVVVALAAWVATRASVPAKVSLNTLDALMVLRTTVVVGLNEEWIFRGLMLAALCRWFGWRRGAYCSMVLFGAFHLLNAAAGVPWWAALVQTIMAGMAGAIFVTAAVAMRSIAVPVIAHGIYDFAVIDASRMASLGGSSIPALFVPLVSLTLAVWCVVRIWHMADAPPYGD